MAIRIKIRLDKRRCARPKLAQAMQSLARMGKAFLVWAWLSLPLYGAVDLDPAASGETAGESGYYADFGEKKKEAGHSLAPVVGYDPTYRFVVGAAYFYMTERLSLGLDANTNFSGVYQAHVRASHEFAPRWNYELRLGGMKGFEAYYGDGGDTSVDDYQQLWGNRYNSRLQLSRQLTDHFAMGIFAELRGRTEEGAGNPAWSRVAMDQSVAAGGVSIKLDSRKDKQRSNDGVVLSTELLHSLSGATSPFTQLESSFVVYKDVMGDFFPGVVAAFRVMGGISDGDVPFVYRYRFGGAEKMRGYLENRFRGSRYYLQQTELRVPIWRMIGGALSLGFGDISDREFTNPKMCYGIGVRIGLPPDWVSQVRIDVGFARDQMGIFAEFGQTF